MTSPMTNSYPIQISQTVVEVFGDVIIREKIEAIVKGSASYFEGMRVANERAIIMMDSGKTITYVGKTVDEVIKEVWPEIQDH